MIFLIKKENRALSREHLIMTTVIGRRRVGKTSLLLNSRCMGLKQPPQS